MDLDLDPALAHNRASARRRPPRRRRGPVVGRLRHQLRHHPRLLAFVPGRSLRVQLLGASVAVLVALSAHSFASAREAGASYVVQPGETLSGIAATTGVPVGRLAGLNALGDPDVIRPGQVIQLSDGAAAPSQAPAATVGAGGYVVQPGDTIWDIAQARGTTTGAIVKLNGLADGDRLQLGQRLQLPATATSPQAPATAAGQASSDLQKAGAPAAPLTATLTQRVLATVHRTAGDDVRVGIAAKNLVTGERVRLRADEVFPSASVMKLPLLVELERAAAAGDIRWTDALRANAQAMIAVSDNQAANTIEDLVTDAKVNGTMARLGLANTALVNHFSDGRNTGNPGNNQTTPLDMAKLLDIVANDGIVNRDVSADIRTLLARNADNSKLARLLPGDARVAHKSGWYEGVANDVGIVTVDSTGARWVIAVFTDGAADADTGNQVIAAVSLVMYNAWSGSAPGAAAR